MKQVSKDTYFYIKSIRGSKKGSQLTKQDLIELGYLKKEPRKVKTVAKTE